MSNSDGISHESHPWQKRDNQQKRQRGQREDILFLTSNNNGCGVNKKREMKYMNGGGSILCVVKREQVGYS